MAAVIPVGQSEGWLFIPASQVLTCRMSVLLNSVFILNISNYIFFFHYMIVIVSDFVSTQLSSSFFDAINNKRKTVSLQTTTLDGK